MASALRGAVLCVCLALVRHVAVDAHRRWNDALRVFCSAWAIALRVNTLVAILRGSFCQIDYPMAVPRCTPSYASEIAGCQFSPSWRPVWLYAAWELTLY